MRLDQTEARILAALIEKGWTTPQQYPLTLSALMAACNQKSNRDPVMSLNTFEIEACLLRMRPRGLIRQHERDSGRVARFEGLLAKELGLTRQEEAIVAELLLRGPQTAPELARRCGRMAPYSGASEVEALLGGLARRELVRLLPRGSGQRHARWTEIMTPQAEAAQAAPEPEPEPEPEPSVEAPAAAAQPSPPPAAPLPAAPFPTTGAPATGLAPATAAPSSSLRDDLEALRREVAELRARVIRLEAL